MAKLLDFPRNRHGGGFEGEWLQQLQACRDEWRAIEAAAEPARIELLIRIAIDLYPAVLEDEDGFRRFCQDEEIQRHGRTEIMLLRLIMSDDFSDGTARRYGDVILWVRNYGDAAELRRIGIVKAHQALRRHIGDKIREDWNEQGVEPPQSPVDDVLANRVRRANPATAAPRSRDTALWMPAKTTIAGSHPDRWIVRPEFARKVVSYFNPKPGEFSLDPFCGYEAGGFIDALPDPCDFCEIMLGRDFFDWTKKVAWIFGNPMWDKTFEAVALHAYEIANNIVWLVRSDMLNTTRRVKHYLAAGFDVKQEITVRWQDAFVNTTAGFRLVLVHLQRGYKAKERSYWL